MKKRVISFVMALSIMLSLIYVPAVAQEQNQEAEFMAGYAKVDITPTEALPLAGYGSADRVFTEVETNLYVTAIAMTDKYGTNALFISVDTYNTNQMWSNDAKTAIVEALGADVIDIDRIYISATTTMSAPEMVYSGVDEEMATKVEAYKQMVITACADAAEAAYADRTAVTMYHNDMDASEGMVHLKAEAGETVADGDPVTRLNYNNHYNVVSKTDASEKYVAGVGFGPQSYINNKNYTATEVAQPDDTMGLLIFKANDGSKEDIVLANWSAKANISSSGVNRYGIENNNALSADYVGFFRDKMAENGMRTAFFQATSGNVSAFPQLTSLRNPDVMADVAYTEEVDGAPVEKTAKSITSELYGEKLAQLALHGLTHEDGENHLHVADMDAPINNYKFRFAVAPDVPTDTQVELVNTLKTTEMPAIEQTPEEELEDEIDPGMATYASLYEYLVGNWEEAKPVAVQMLTDAGKTQLADELSGLVKATQLTGIATRMAHTVNASSTNFATDAVYCDATVLQLGKMTFVMAPADLYDHYGQEGTSKDWNSVGAHFVLGNTNGASGFLPNAASFHYNEGSDQYITGTNNTWSTAFPEGAGELLMETYANVKKTMTATVDDPQNQIRMQCECGGLAEGKPGHTCEIKAFYPWYDPDSLPVSGNYYLMTDVTILREARTGTADKCFDLNGHTITRKVLKEVTLDQTLQPIPEDHYYHQTRLFALEQNARLTITDTVGGGKLTRDISDLEDVSADEQKKITNYGLLVALIDGNDSEFILYNGTLDATGQYSCGGACVANMSAKATFTMYDGELKGGISDRGAAVYAGGTNAFYGGTITGGEVKDTADAGDTVEKNGSVNLLTTGKLLLAGDTTIEGGKLGEQDCNLVINNSESLMVDENYTGTAGISVKVDDPNGTIIGWLENVPESAFDNFTVDDFANYEVMLCNRNAVTIGEIRTYCECGGKAAGKHDHVCQDIQWKPWPTAYNKYLPDSDIGGNYYLLCDINLAYQKVVAKEQHLDLNGHNITHVVTPDEGATLAEMNNKGTRVFYVGEGGSFSITDSTDNPGTVKRDLSNLTEEQKNGITNYGIIVFMNEETTGDFVLYNGILDASGQITGGGALASRNKELAIRIYGGEVKGAISANGGCIYSWGPVWIHGGKITGGESTGNSVGGINIAAKEGVLYLCGDAEVTGNVDKDGNPANIRASSADQIIVADDFEGTAGIMLNAEPTHLTKLAKGNVDLTNATITGETYTEGYELRVVDGYIVTFLDAAFITAEDSSVTYYKTLQDAFDAYPGGKATITLHRDVAENNLSMSNTTYLDLAGYDLANTGYEANGTLYIFDSETDDYTAENGNGYGLVTGDIAQAAEGLPLDSDIVTAVKPTDLYLKITENDGTSFHRLNLRFAGITLRPDSMKDGSYWPGLFYNSQFGGDEVIKRNIKSYGIGMSAIDGEQMFTRDKSYTAIDAENWIVGADKDGNSNNMQNGTILTGIMKTENPTIINRRNGNRAVRGQNYVILTDGTRIVGPEASYSLKDIFEGNGITGVDSLFAGMSEPNQTKILKLYKNYESVMKHWNIPNIKAEASK